MSAPRIYTASFSAVATTTATDLFELTCAADRPIDIIGWTIFQTTDLGDAAEEVLSLTVERGVTAGTGGTASTEVDYGGRGESTADTTVNHMVTTAHTGGTVMFRKGWNIRIPEEFWLPERLYGYADAGTDPVTLTMTAPADSITMSGTIFWMEY
jgi:hypothetical protein